VVLKNRRTNVNSFDKIAAALIGGLALSVLSSNAQTLDLTNATLVGSSPLQDLVEAFPTNGLNDGTISTWVVNDPSLDPSGYTFIYQVVNNSADYLDQVELTGFTSSQIVSDGTFSSEAGLTLADAVAPSSDGIFPYFQVVGQNAATFEVGDLSDVSPGNDSFFLVIETDVNYFGTSYGQIQDGLTATGSILVPVPEPSASLLVLAGFASLYGLCRFRRLVN
jgi:hypothetical protein